MKNNHCYSIIMKKKKCLWAKYFKIYTNFIYLSNILKCEFTCQAFSLPCALRKWSDETQILVYTIVLESAHNVSNKKKMTNLCYIERRTMCKRSSRFNAYIYVNVVQK